MQENLIKSLNKVTKLANYTKIQRFLHHPFKYIFAMYFREFIYPKTKQEKIVTAPLFYGEEMKIALPASMDIYLTRGKSHFSETRLASFLLKNLENGAHFLDIGAHFGYFTLLAAKVVGLKGKVYSFEPSEKSFNLLKLNTEKRKNISCFNQAVSDKEGEITFYQFPVLYSEYNSMDIAQYENEAWFQNLSPLNSKNMGGGGGNC